MKDIADRIQEQMKVTGIKQADIQRATGAGKATISGWVKGSTKPSSEYLTPLASVLKCNTNWLLTGQGNPSDQVISSAGIANIEPIPQKIRKAPVLNWVQAGEFTDIYENGYDEYEYFYDDGYGLQVYWLHIRGDSMEPQFFEGDKILVDADRQANAGDYVIAMVDHESQATFKRYKPCGYDEKLGREYCQLVPLNEFYPIIDSRAVHINIIGVVVKHERKLI
jgi:SOS-response transcriptional repressor LexA